MAAATHNVVVAGIAPGVDLPVANVDPTLDQPLDDSAADIDEPADDSAGHEVPVKKNKGGRPRKKYESKVVSDSDKV